MNQFSLADPTAPVAGDFWFSEPQSSHHQSRQGPMAPPASRLQQAHQGQTNAFASAIPPAATTAITASTGIQHTEAAVASSAKASKHKPATAPDAVRMTAGTANAADATAAQAAAATAATIKTAASDSGAAHTDSKAQTQHPNLPAARDNSHMNHGAQMQAGTAPQSLLRSTRRELFGDDSSGIPAAQMEAASSGRPTTSAGESAR